MQLVPASTLAATLLLLPAASALPFATLDHRDTRIHGHADLVAELVGFTEMGNPSLQATWNLTADSVDVEQEIAVLLLDTPLVGVQQDLAENTYTLTHATGHALSHPEDYSIDLLALPGHPPPQVKITSACLELDSNSTGKHTTHAFVEGYGKRPTVDLGKTVAATSCQAIPELVVEGDFVLSLWEITTYLQDANGARTLISGHHSRSSHTNNVEAGRVEQDYLTVHGGRLTYTPGSTLRLHVHQLQGLVEGTATFTDYSCPLGQGQTLTLQGALQLSTTRSSNRLNSLLEGSVSHVEGDGNRIFPAASSVRLLDPDSKPLWLGLLGSVMAGAVAHRIKTRRDRKLTSGGTSPRIERHRDLAEDLYEAGATHRAAAHIRHVLRRLPGDPYAHLLLAHCHDQDTHPRRCQRHAQRAYDLLEAHGDAEDPGLPDAAYLLSRSRAMLGLPEALAWLHVAVRHEPNLAAKARDDPAFFNFWKDPDFKSIIDGAIRYRVNEP